MIKANSDIYVVDRANLSHAWGEVLVHLTSTGVNEVSPLVLRVRGFNGDSPPEDHAIKEQLDGLLAANKVTPDVEGVAHTIFPAEYLKLAGGDRQEFFDLFIASAPRLRDYDRRNKNGTYFERLVDFNGDGRGPNQLERIIAGGRGGHGMRASFFQASVYDPPRDYTHAPYMGFPCMQQVSFVPVRDKKLGDGLALNAFYATQQILRKGYGNYLGLARLGAFMAREMDLRFAGLNVFVGVAQFDKVGKSDTRLKALVQDIEAAL